MSYGPQLPSLTDVRYLSQLRAGWEQFSVSDGNDLEACDDCQFLSQSGYFHLQHNAWLCVPCWQAKIEPTVPKKAKRRRYVKEEEPA